MTGYEQMKKLREETLNQSIIELEHLADQNKECSHYLSEEAFKMGLKFAIREIEGTEMLFLKMMKEIKFKDPIEAEREHMNQMNTLAVLKAKLIRRYEGKP